MLALRTLNSEGFDDPLSFNGISRYFERFVLKPSCVLVRYLGREELASPRDLDDRCGVNWFAQTLKTDIGRFMLFEDIQPFFFIAKSCFGIARIRQ